MGVVCRWVYCWEGMLHSILTVALLEDMVVADYKRGKNSKGNVFQHRCVPLTFCVVVFNVAKDHNTRFSTHGFAILVIFNNQDTNGGKCRPNAARTLKVIKDIVML